MECFEQLKKRKEYLKEMEKRYTVRYLNNGLWQGLNSTIDFDLRTAKSINNDYKKAGFDSYIMDMVTGKRIN